LASGGGQPNINQETLRGLKVACPDLNEQNAIVDFLDAELATFDALTAEAQRAIDLLQERRTALISVAVTGQIDVRKNILE
jgi:type I restriction enzyme S subunit